MSYRADKQVITAHTDGRTHRQTQPTTIPEGQNWPRVNTISDSYTECPECKLLQNHEPLKHSEPGTRPRDKVAVDLLTFHGHYLVLVDAYREWMEIKYLRSTMAQTVVNWLREIFIIHGFPNELHSDNVVQFPVKKTMDYTDQYDIKQVTSSPHFHQSNSLAECGV